MDNESERSTTVRQSVVRELKATREEEPEFGGDVENFDELRYESQKERTAGPLGMLLVKVMFGLILVHYGSTIVLELTGHQEGVDRLFRVFTTWLPAMSGFLGAAAMYYYSGRRGR